MFIQPFLSSSAFLFLLLSWIIFRPPHRSSQLQLLVLPRYLVSVVFQILWIWCLVCCTDVYNTIGIYFKGHGNLWVPFGPCGIFESLNWPICLLSLTNVLSLDKHLFQHPFGRLQLWKTFAPFNWNSRVTGY